ncbi:hypothetical protein ABL78_1224 [Leptomonas seymouri]|uniref:DNA repair metallo-beta-lactamase domain-containing protein n=1 Tax=Leptomonas seymouri TaxID=5684 RepID=A0A0N1IAX7_LEPSE|nr:hypothetical protein ABL78_1224 [Leptomonas seymouri]|eukprot:KPI89643.1 hypothetical protein ABL78_1224 [Leptomonas seymouri]
MWLPSLSVFIDEFPALRSRVWHSAPLVELFVLSHFHTDHMRGLHSGWSAGIILASNITKQLLLSRFEGLRGRVFGLPLWCRTPFLTAAAATEGHAQHGSAVCCSHGCGHPDHTAATSDASTVYITLLPAFHIPGSAMVYLEMPSGVTYLYTGDFKFTEAAQQSPLRSFLQSHRVDHLYIDDTWLHLGHVELTQWPAWGSERDDSGMRVLSKLLNSEQVAEAIEAIGRRMDHQRLLFDKWQRTRLVEANSGGSCAEGYASTADCSRTRQPFVVRVYLHNQFGKEVLIQQLAERLRTRAVIDDVRYARLLTAVEALEEERDDLQAFEFPSARATGQSESSPRATASGTAPTPGHAGILPLSQEEQAWRSSGGEAAQYPYDLRYFVSASQASALRSPPKAIAPGAKEAPRSSSSQELPLIEVVSSRADISPAALQEASKARGGTPHYGVVISGWARLQPQTHDGPSASGQVWHIPTTLHSTPQEVINMVALLRPLSVTPLHHRPSRAAVMMQRLGPYLRSPFVNQRDTGLERIDVHSSHDGHTVHTVTCWTLCLPAHVLCQDRHSSLVVEEPRPGSSMDGSSRPGLRDGGGDNRSVPDDGASFKCSKSHIEPFGSVITARNGVAGHPEAGTTPTNAPLWGKQLLPSWALSSLTEAYLKAQGGSSRKRGRVAEDAARVAASCAPATANFNDASGREQQLYTFTSLADIADEVL